MYLKSYNIDYIDAKALKDEIKSSSCVVEPISFEFNNGVLKISGSQLNNELELDNIILTHNPIEFIKSLRYKEIDEKTELLINNGYIYSGIVFSLSDNAQKNLLGAYSAKELLTYPFSWNSKDDTTTYEITDVIDMTNFFMTALSTKKSHQDSGSAIKEQIRNCNTIEQVNSIIDNR